jgi:hypothetical protein
MSNVSYITSKFRRVVDSPSPLTDTTSHGMYGYIYDPSPNFTCIDAIIQ